jgi:hypothetical protein
LDVNVNPHFVDNRLTDGGNMVSLTRRPSLTPNYRFLVFIYVRVSGSQGHSAAGRIKSIERSNDPIENRISNLPVCSTLRQTTPLSRAPTIVHIAAKYVDRETDVKSER